MVDWRRWFMRCPPGQRRLTERLFWVRTTPRAYLLSAWTRAIPVRLAKRYPPLISRPPAQSCSRKRKRDKKKKKKKQRRRSPFSSQSEEDKVTQAEKSARQRGVSKSVPCSTSQSQAEFVGTEAGCFGEGDLREPVAWETISPVLAREIASPGLGSVPMEVESGGSSETPAQYETTRACTYMQVVSGRDTLVSRPTPAESILHLWMSTTRRVQVSRWCTLCFRQFLSLQGIYVYFTTGACCRHFHA